MDVDVERNCLCDNILELEDDDNIVDKLKNKISCEFLTLLIEVERGYRPEYDDILNEISLLDIYKEIDKKDFILQYYLNK